jgi:hypothetical protein
MQPDGTYIQRTPTSVSAPCGSHYRMIARTEKRVSETLKHKKKMRKK